jgi:L-alanine-DL-glutamate epimerase-like enolase superfamily enzyme
VISSYRSADLPSGRRAIEAGPDQRADAEAHVGVFEPIVRVDVTAFRIPTAAPESDGTLEWDATTLVVAEPLAAGVRGFGYSYADTSTARLIQDLLAGVIVGRDPMDVPGSWLAMVHAIRNLGRPGVVSMAISAVDNALWDLKAKLLGVPLAALFGRVRERVPVYGSGGFTSYSIQDLEAQLGGWAVDGMTMVKMKVGRDPAADIDRVKAARTAIGPDVALFVDANGAYERKQALEFARAFADLGVSWFEEPVSSDDLDGLRLIRDAGPPGMVITAGEYGYDLPYFRRMLEAGAVDVVQADATRCAGLSEFLRVGALCWSRSLPLSSHCAPSIHVAAGCALPGLVHLEYFADHARIEGLVLDGPPRPIDGHLQPDLSRPGLGIELKRSDAAPWQVPI